jgi:hypothetical protein
VKDYKNMMCVWMSSGVVEYKLCDRKFDCENCQFDKVIRNKISTEQKNDYYSFDIIDEVINKINNEAYDSRYTYLNNFMMLKYLFVSKYYIGFSPLTSFLLDNVEISSLCSRGRNILKGNPMLKLNWEWGSIEIEAPFDFTCLGQFEGLNNSNNRTPWFGLIDLKENEKLGSITKDEYQNSLRSISKELSIIKRDIGATPNYMQDGGTPEKSLSKRIGKEKYLELLKKVIEIKS